MFERFLAERKGFEPLNGFIRYTISNRAPSTSSAIFPNSFYIIAWRLRFVNTFLKKCKKCTKKYIYLLYILILFAFYVILYIYQIIFTNFVR